MQSPPPKFRISKLSAARRQMDCAIELWFLDKDAVSIHTLAAAAHQIIHDLNNRKQGHEALLFDSNRVTEQNRKQWIDVLKQPGNFFKHADNDPDGIFEFIPRVTLGFILTAIIGLTLLGEEPSEHMNALGIWLHIHEPEWFRESDLAKHLKDNVRPEHIESVKTIRKADFLKFFISNRALIRAGLI